MRKLYHSGPRAAPKRPRGDFLPNPDDHYEFIPDLTVYDAEPQIVDTGIIDVNGDPITYEVGGMLPIGFLHAYPREDDEDEE